MEAKMEPSDFAALLTAIGGLGTGIFGGIKLAGSRQVEEVKALITQYKDANEFNKKEVLDVKLVLAETRKMHKECEERSTLQERRIDELDARVKTIAP
jgi:uncharacterized protein HemX